MTSSGASLAPRPRRGITIPVLAIGGWNDSYFRAGTLTNIEALPSRTWAIYGPFAHFFPVALVEDSTIGMGDQERAMAVAQAPPLPSGVLLAWFDHWVAGLPDVPIPADPTFASYEGPTGVGQGWQELDGWDGPDADSPEIVLVTDGRRSSFRQPAPSDDDVDAVVFTSQPLVVDEVLLGHPSLAVVASLDAPEAHLYVELLDVGADGEERLVNDGFLAASHRRSHSDPLAVVVGEPTEYRISIRPAHHRFRVGGRVRVRLSGGRPSALTAPPTPVTVSIEAGRAALRLPGFSSGG